LHTTLPYQRVLARESKPIMVKNMFPAGPLALLLVLGASVFSPAWASHQTADAGAGDSAAVVSDWHTGLALYGFDPVAYFAAGRPVAGRGRFERTIKGSTWRFSNAGNLAAFEANAAVYAPRFGGYDPLALGRGIATPGNPFIWLVFGARLYLFHDAAARAAFLADPRHVLAAAAAQWPAVSELLHEAR
jgi:hypothetical protein